MRLFRAEWLRLTHRGAVRWLMLALLALGVATGFGIANTNARPSDATIAQMQAQADQVKAQWVADGGPAQQQQCYTDEAAGRAANPELDPDYMGCDSMNPDTWTMVWSPPKLDESFKYDAGNAAAVGAIAAWLIAMLLVGSEFSSRAMGTWLTYEPRRLYVYATKLAAPALAGGVLAVLLMAGFVGEMALVWALNGYSMAVAHGFWWHLVAVTARSAGLSALMGLAGAAVTFMVRQIWLGLAAPLAYLVATEVGVGSFMINGAARPSLPGWLQNLMLSQASSAAVSGSYTWYSPVQDPTCGGNIMIGTTCYAYVPHVITCWQGWAFVLVLTAVLVAVGWAVFARRDVN